MEWILDPQIWIALLALSFLILIGVNLVADGLGRHIPKGYTYFAMAFSVMVEMMINLKLRARTETPAGLGKCLMAHRPKAKTPGINALGVSPHLQALHRRHNPIICQLTV
jgi:hypothetical protein